MPSGGLIILSTFQFPDPAYPTLRKIYAAQSFSACLLRSLLSWNQRDLTTPLEQRGERYQTSWSITYCQHQRQPNHDGTSLMRRWLGSMNQLIQLFVQIIIALLGILNVSKDALPGFLRLKRAARLSVEKCLETLWASILELIREPNHQNLDERYPSTEEW